MKIIQKNPMNRKSNILQNPYFLMWIITSALFGILFVRFILGGYAYLYTDVGRDTLDINYPLFSYFSDVFHGKGYSEYALNVGLGLDISSYWWQYLNPINLLVVILPKHLIPWGILAALYVKLMMIGIWGYKLMYCWLKSKWPAVCAAVLWTFSGYVMLWGQHYAFCTFIALFTVFLYLIHLYIDEECRSRNWILVPWITLMMITNYYSLYMSGLIAGLYIIIYLVFQKKSFRIILQKLIGLGLMAALGIGMAGCALISDVAIFSESARSSAASVGKVSALFTPISLKTFFASFARLFSNNVLGIGNDYTGNMNYYEIPVLYTSALFVFALPYLLWNKKTRIKTAVFTAAAVLMLILPFTGKIFCLNPKAFRWTFALCLLEILGIGIFLKMIMEEQDKKIRRKTMMAGGIFLAAGIVILYLGRDVGEYEIAWKYLAVEILFVLAYAVILEKCRNFRAGSILLLSVIFVEMAVNHYPTINFRENITRSELASMSYHDGTEQAYDILKAEDASVYRVAKTYQSESRNDSLVQGYNGLDTYMTTNPRALIHLKDTYGGVGESVNFVTFPQSQFLFNSLLGVKYLIAEPVDPVSEDTYSFVGTMDSKNVYKNNYELPFGYLYDKEWKWSQIREMDVNQRVQAMLSGFYFTTDTRSDETYEKVEYKKSNEENRISLMTMPYTAENCNVTLSDSGISITDMGEDPYFVMNDLTDKIAQKQFMEIAMEVSSQEDTEMAVYYKLEGQTDFQGTQVLIFKVPSGVTSWNETIPGNISGLRFDVNENVEEVQIHDITIDSCESEHKALEKLQSSAVANVVWKNSTYEADVSVSGNTSMLCVPLLYSRGWTVSIDQKDAMVYDINCGLCGIEVPNGTHHIVLCYETPNRKIGVMLSCTCLAIYLFWLLMIWVRRMRKYPRK